MAEQQDDEATVIRPRRPGRSAAPIAADAEDTIVRLIEPAAPAPSLPTRAAARAASAPPAAPAAVPLGAVPPGALPPADESPGAGAWAVRLRGAAVVVPLDRPLVVGRRPGAARPGEHPTPRLLVVPPERADVSGRHARLEQLGETLVVADLGSTNGIVVHWSAGAPRRLRPGESCAVLPDARIELGEGVVLEFVPAPVSPSITHPTPEPPS